MKYIVFSLFSLFLFGCKNYNENFQKDISNPDFLHRSLEKYTEIIVHDIFSPPVASRNYAYATIAAYEACRHANSTYASLEGQLHGLSNIPQPSKSKKYCFELAGVRAMITCGRKFIFSESDLNDFETALMKEIEMINMPKEIYNSSIAYGEEVAKHIMSWADKDTYKQSRSYSKFSIDTEVKSRWRPTPPGYMDAVEPHWRSIRTMVMDSAGQFKPAAPTPFSTDKKSKFFAEANEVYVIGKNLSEEQKEIANFWDCNPYKLNVTGHAMHATKKISPGGHWMSIARLVTKKSNADFVKTAQTYVMTSIALFEGFISCWDEKYRSNMIRPESIINEYIDDAWSPLLQTPPFPEYTSGHSVISAASAEVLTHLYGDNFAYADSTEVRFGLPVRNYKSFYNAAQEASISRMYGGIHYRPAIENGIIQGKEIGKFIIQKIKFKK
ncbi:MAG: hypothetical protein RLZZ546_2956 [Bacteroidota bacterium]|jgi:hypothetical protein